MSDWADIAVRAATFIYWWLVVVGLLVIAIKILVYRWLRKNGFIE